MHRAVGGHARQGGAIQILLTFQAEGGHGAAQDFRSADEAAEAHVVDLLGQVHGAGQGGVVAQAVHVRVGAFSVKGDGPVAERRRGHRAVDHGAVDVGAFDVGVVVGDADRADGVLSEGRSGDQGRGGDRSEKDGFHFLVLMDCRPSA
ncbi:hypothetical protein D3C77_452300 [compost metagenome]